MDTNQLNPEHMNSNKLIPASFILALGILFAGYFVGNFFVKAKKFDRSVVVKGLAEKEVLADLAIWPLNFTEASNNLAEIERNIKEKSDLVISFLKEKGFGDDEISRGLPAIMDAWANPYAQQGQSANRYTGSFAITVRTADIPKLKNAMEDITSLIGQGIVLGQSNYWQQVEYLYTALNDIKPAMIEEATKNARQAAEKFAVDSNSKVGKIKTANQGLFTISNRDMNSPHIKKVRVVTTVEFYLDD
jgi:hypothetical protein